MASHYDFKVKTLKHFLFGPSSYTIWIPLFKAIKDRNFYSYLFVYRYLLIPLLLDVASLFALFFGIRSFVISSIFLQLIELIYCIKIKRKGYFITWKVAIINFPRVFQTYLRKRTVSVEHIN